MARRKFLEGYRPNFETLRRAFSGEHVVLLECKDRRTGRLVAAVCAVNRESDGNFSFVPFARMLENGYADIMPPKPEGGFDGEVRR